MGICGSERKKNKIDQRKIDTKRAISKINSEIELLNREVNELYSKLQSTDGNMNKAEREEIEDNLFEKIEEIEELMLNKKALNTDLKELNRGERNKNVEDIMKRNVRAIDKNQPDNQFMEERYDILNNVKRENDLRNKKIKKAKIC